MRGPSLLVPGSKLGKVVAATHFSLLGVVSCLGVCGMAPGWHTWGFG